MDLLSNAQQFYGFPKGSLLQLYVDYGDGTSADAVCPSARQPQIRLRIKSNDSIEFTEIISPFRQLLSATNVEISS